LQKIIKILLDKCEKLLQNYNVMQLSSECCYQDQEISNQGGNE